MWKVKLDKYWLIKRPVWWVGHRTVVRVCGGTSCQCFATEQEEKASFDDPKLKISALIKVVIFMLHWQRCALNSWNLVELGWTCKNQTRFNKQVTWYHVQQCEAC